MEKVGFLTDNIDEAVSAFDQMVVGKKKIEGLELSPTGPDPGIGQGIRRVQALNRMDIPLLWRVVVRAATKKTPPIISVIPPRGKAPGDATDVITGARLYAPQMAAGPESFDCTFPPETGSHSLVEWGVQAVRAFGAKDIQWTVRERGLLPR